MFVEARTKGIVLASYDLDKADKIFICYTLDYGKIEIIGRGVKKSSSRLAAHLEIFIINDLLLIFSAKNNILRSCFTIDNFTNIRRNMDLYFSSSYILELVDKMAPLNDPEPRIFFLLAESLNMLNAAKNKNEMEFIVSRFQFKFLDLSGLHPRFDECVLCGKKTSYENMFFSFKNEGAVCSRCKNNEAGSLKLTAKLAKALDVVFEEFGCRIRDGKSVMNKETAGALRKIGSFLIMCHLGKKIMSEAYINQ